MSPRFLYVILGFWLMISPWIFGMSGVAVLKWNNVLVGLIIFLAGVWEVYGKRDEPLS
jgi:hypothetical protein